jgi:hypothetical protein
LFFSQAFALRDWIADQTALKTKDIQKAIDGKIEMQICRDICNRYKHLSLKSPSIDAHWDIKRSLINGFLYGDEWEWKITADMHQFTLFDLMIKCIAFWDDFISESGLTVPVS